MQRTAVIAITGAAVAATLVLSGCSDKPGDSNPCGSQPIVYVEENETYHCGSATGMVVAVYEIDDDTKRKAKATPGKPVTFNKAPKAPANKPAAPNFNKPAAPKAPAAPRPAGKR